MRGVQGLARHGRAFDDADRAGLVPTPAAIEAGVDRPETVMGRQHDFGVKRGH
jgi:hypothetical protein